MKYSELINKHEEKNIPYFELLEVEEWKQKRKEHPKEEVFVNHVILNSGSLMPLLFTEHHTMTDRRIILPDLTPNSIYINVHHKFYIHEKLPWEYEDADLITICNLCHIDIHRKEKIPIYTIINGEMVKLQYTPCLRCQGIGYFPEYRHVENGLCFRCRGKRFEELIVHESDIPTPNL